MRGLILLTCLPPTTGHSDLVRWASAYMQVLGVPWHSQLNVLVCTQPEEPMPETRFYAMKEHLTNVPFVNVRHTYCKMPQYPKNDQDTDFWDAWTKEIYRQFPSAGTQYGGFDYVFSSEQYGYRLAEELNAKHVIFDPRRNTNATKATIIRNFPKQYFDYIIPEFRKYLQKRVTLFGAESTGKTTIANYVSEGRYIPEYARGYLESLSSPEVTSERMLDIVLGQYVSQGRAPDDVPVIIQDTDLLSTIGYYRLYDPNYHEDSGYRLALELFKKSKSDLYVVLSANIPFTKDPLRYGGDKRESDDTFWIELLKDFDCNYEVITETIPHYRYKEVATLVNDLFKDQPIWKYQREKAE